MMIRILVVFLVSSMGVVASQGTKSNIPYSQEIYGIAQVIEQLLQSVATLVSEENQKRVEIVSSVVKDSYQVLAKAESMVGEIKLFEERGNRFKEQISCIRLSEAAMVQRMSCTTVNCQNKKACLSAMVLTAKSFIEPLVVSMFGKARKDGAKYVIDDPGILLIVTQLKVIPENHKKVFTERLQDYAIKISSALEFLNLIAFILNPVIEPVGLTPAQVEDLKAEPIAIPADEEDFGFED